MQNAKWVSRSDPSRRTANAQFRVDTEDRLEEALQTGKKAEAQACSRVLAGNAMGVQKRRLNTLCSYCPSEAELLESAKLEASLGGLSAVPIDWEE